MGALTVASPLKLEFRVVPPQRARRSLRIVRVGLEHFKAAVASDVGDLDQVRAALHRGGHEARPQAKATALSSSLAATASGASRPTRPSGQ